MKILYEKKDSNGRISERLCELTLEEARELHDYAIGKAEQALKELAKWRARSLDSTMLIN